MKSFKYILVIALSLMVVTLAGAQEDRRDVRKGNRDFKKESWREAEIDYRKALVKDSLSVAANYNLANTLYREGNVEQARKVLETIKDVAPASASAADYYYNLGDAAIAMQDWQTAVDAFKESLLRNPGDLAAKENYIYAKKKLEDQQQNQQNDQNQDNQDQNNDQNQQNDQNQNNDQNQDQQEDNRDQNDQEDNQDQNQDRQEQPQQGQQPKISPQAAQQMLQAIQAQEKETQDKVNKQKAEALKSRQKEKNW